MTLDEHAALRAILEGTASEVGEGFFAALARSVAEALGTCGAWVTEYLERERRLRAFAFWLDGRFVPLSRAGASVLSELFDAAGRVLSREQLGLALPRGGESAHAVEMAVARLREALGGASVIQTIVKRGYRLTVEDPE